MEKTSDIERLMQRNRMLLYHQHFPVEYWRRMHAHVNLVLPDPLVGLGQ